MSRATSLTTSQLREHVDRVPRVRLAHLPTPLEDMPRFSKSLGGPPVLIKRDDCTGLAMGGNKTRHNEFIFGHAVEQKAEMFVWGAGVQSNNCRQTAAACAKLGLECRLVLSRSHFVEEMQGNLLLDHLLGAKVQIVDAPIGEALDAAIAAEADRQRAAGRRVYHWDREVVKPRAAISYVLCLVEIIEQLAERGQRPQAVYVCSAGSTGAGLALARVALGAEFPVRSIAPIRWPWDTRAEMADEANAAASLMGLDVHLTSDDVELSEDYIGPDYGVASEPGMEALALVARNEAILLDPVYSAKAMSAVVDDIRRGRLNDTGPVVFVHTGGTPALFAFRDALVEMIPACE